MITAIASDEPHDLRHCPVCGQFSLELNTPGVAMAVCYFCAVSLGVSLPRISEKMSLAEEATYKQQDKYWRGRKIS